MNDCLTNLQNIQVDISLLDDDCTLTQVLETLDLLTRQALHRRKELSLIQKKQTKELAE